MQAVFRMQPSALQIILGGGYRPEILHIPLWNELNYIQSHYPGFCSDTPD